MAIAAVDLKMYAAASRPEDDASLTGGAISTAVRFLTQFSAAAVVEVVSDGADVRNITVTGRLASGVVDTEVLALNGANPVAGAKSFERLLKVVASAADGARTVLVKQGAGGTTRGTLAPNETEVTILFKKAASSPSATKTLYEKVFVKNTHATLTLQNSKVRLTADPAAKIEVGVAPSVDDNATVANRVSAPASVSFVDDNVDQSVPGGGNLAAGAAIGVWSKLSLATGNAPIRDTHTIQLSGESV